MTTARLIIYALQEDIARPSEAQWTELHQGLRRNLLLHWPDSNPRIEWITLFRVFGDNSPRAVFEYDTEPKTLRIDVGGLDTLKLVLIQGLGDTLKKMPTLEARKIDPPTRL